MRFNYTKLFTGLPQGLRCNPRHGESVCDWHKVDHSGVHEARPDLSKQGAQVLHPHIFDRGLAVRRACIKIIYRLRHDVVLLHPHEQDFTLVLRAH